MREAINSGDEAAAMKAYGQYNPEGYMKTSLDEKNRLSDRNWEREKIGIINNNAIGSPR